MKKLAIITILLMSTLWSFSQTVRPPLKTKDLQTEVFTWDSLLMFRDSLVYFSPLDEYSFKVHYPIEDWITYNFQPDSIYISELNIWIVNGKPISQGDSTFYVREKPNCPKCYEYSYDNSNWIHWFCGETGASNLSIDYNADDILGIHYHQGYGAYTDSLYFKAIEADSGKVPMIQGDSVVWMLIPKDSLFDEYSGIWLNGNDTIPKQLDSLFDEFSGKWKQFGDTIKKQIDSIFYGGQWIQSTQIVINDTSKTNELDSIQINNVWYKNGGSISLDPSIYNELDSITINGVKYGNDGVVVTPNDTCLWELKHEYGSPDYIFSGKMAAIGDNPPGGLAMLQVSKSQITLPLVWVTQKSTDESAGDLLWLANNDSMIFRVPTNGGFIARGLTYPDVDGDSLQVIATDGNGKLSFVDRDTSLWSISGTGIKSKTKQVSVNSEPVDSYNMSIKADGSDNTLGLWNSGTGNILEGRNYLGASVFNVDKDGYTTSTGLTVGGLNYPTIDGDSLGVVSSDGHGNLSLRNLISENPPSYSGDSILALLTSGHGYSFWGRTSTDSGGEVYGDSVPYYQPYDVNVPIWCGSTPCGFIPVPEFNLKYQKIKSYDYILDSTKVWVANNFGKWTIDTYGMNADTSNVGIGEASKTATKLNVKAATGEFSAEFNGGNGVQADKVTIGTGSTLTRSGTMAAFDIWSGTQAEWTANTPKDGIYPQATTTVWFIKN